MQIIKKENFCDYTGDACEVYQDDIHGAAELLARDGCVSPKEAKKTWRRLRVETVFFVAFLAALLYREGHGGADAVLRVLMGLEAAVFIFVLVCSVHYLRRGKKTYRSVVKLFAMFDAKRDSLDYLSCSQIHAAARKIFEERGIEPQYDSRTETFFTQQKALYELVKACGSEGLGLLGYSQEEKMALLNVKTAEGEDVVVPVINCECVEEDRDAIQFSIHPWASILRVPKP